MKLRELFFRQGPTENSVEYVWDHRWFPDVPEQCFFDWVPDARDKVNKAFRITRLAYTCNDGYRYAGLYTLFFKGEPLMAVQVAGRSGRDLFKRWVVNKDLYIQAKAFLVTLIQFEESSVDFKDIDEECFPEELLCFYGMDLRPEFGQPVPKSLEGIVLLPNERDLIPSLPSEAILALVNQGNPEPPEYMRRNEFVMKKVRLIPHEELDEQNPRVNEVNKSSGVDRTYLYVQVLSWPENTEIAVV